MLRQLVMLKNTFEKFNTLLHSSGFSLLLRFPLATMLTFCTIIRKRDHQKFLNFLPAVAIISLTSWSSLVKVGRAGSYICATNLKKKQNRGNSGAAYSRGRAAPWKWTDWTVTQVWRKPFSSCWTTTKSCENLSSTSLFRLPMHVQR